MRKCYLDANALIYFKNEESSFFPDARKIITSLVEKDFSLFISSLTIDEFLHGLKVQMMARKWQQARIFSKIRFVLKEVLELPSLTIINPPLALPAQLQVVSFMEEFSLRPRDAYHLLTMQTNDVGYFCTFDSDFDQVFKKKVVLPVQA